MAIENSTAIRAFVFNLPQQAQDSRAIKLDNFSDERKKHLPFVINIERLEKKSDDIFESLGEIAEAMQRLDYPELIKQDVASLLWMLLSEINQLRLNDIYCHDVQREKDVKYQYYRQVLSQLIDVYRLPQTNNYLAVAQLLQQIAAQAPDGVACSKKMIRSLTNIMASLVVVASLSLAVVSFGFGASVSLFGLVFGASLLKQISVAGAVAGAGMAVASMRFFSHRPEQGSMVHHVENLGDKVSQMLNKPST